MMDKTDGRFLRAMYAAEIAILAVPTVGLLMPFLGALLFVGYGGLAATVFGLPPLSGTSWTTQMVFSLILAGIATAALVALWNFARLSFGYLTGRNIRTLEDRCRFRIGLWTSAVPMLFTLAAATRENPSDAPLWWAFCFSGLPMLVPVLHLGLATKLEE